MPRKLRLSPRDTRVHLWMMFVGAANLHLGADAEALAWCRRGLEVNRNHSLSHFQHAAALALLGHMNEAWAELGLDSVNVDLITVVADQVEKIDTDEVK